MMSSQGERILRIKILNNLTALEVVDPEDLQVYVEAAISAIKKDDYFVHCGDILQVTWDNPIDWRDDKVIWSIASEDYDSDSEYEGDEDGEYDI